MLSKPVTELLEEIFAKAEILYAEEKERENRKKVQEDPEACLISLLNSIKMRLPEGSAMLRSTVQMGTYERSIQEAKEALELATK